MVVWHFKITSLTLRILMDFPIHIDTISMGLPIVYFKGSQVEFSNVYVFRSLKVVIIRANRVDPDEVSITYMSSGLNMFSKFSLNQGIL